MSETNPQLTLQKIYLKDVSLETPMGIKAFQQNWNPKLNQQLQTQHSKIDEKTYEVVLTTTLTAALGDKGEEKTVFIVEIQQAGIFQLKAATEEQEKTLINATCPGILFPYTREAVDNLIVKAGFPAISMPPINFEALYQQAQQNPSPEKPH